MIALRFKPLPHRPTNSRQSIVASSTARHLSIRVMLPCLMLALMLSGCVRLASNLMYVIKGRDAPAEFKEFEDKKVAVIVSTPSGFNADASAIVLARLIQGQLAQNVKKIKLVNPEEVERIINDQPTSQQSMGIVGSRLGADYVLQVDLQNLKLQEGKTLFRGKSDVSIAVFKVAEGDRAVFRKQLPEIVYPQVGVPVTDFEESKFQGIYLAVVASKVSRTFHPYDPTGDVALDATVYGLERLQ